MPEMNPIILTLLKLIEAKQQDESLTQRKQEQSERNKLALESLARQGRVDKANLAHQRAIQALSEAQIKAVFEDKFRAQAFTGQRALQGLTELPSSRQPYLPEGPVPYDASEEDIASRTLSKFAPFGDQYAQGPLGPQLIEGVVPYEKAREQKLSELRQQLGLDVLKAGLTTQAQEAARQPGRVELEDIKTQNATNLQTTQISATDKRAQLDRESRERMAQWRIKAATSGSQLNDPLIDSAYLATIGKADLTGNSNNVIRQRSLIRQQGRVPFSSKDAENLTLSKQAQSILDDIKVIIPSLPSSSGGILVSGTKSLIIGTDVKNKIDALMARCARVAEIYGERGRKSEGDIMRAASAMLSRWTTKEQAALRWDNLKRDFDNTIINSALKNVPDEQRLQLLQSFEFNPETITTRVGGKNVPKYFQDDKDGSWKVYDPKKNKYVDIPESKMSPSPNSNQNNSSSLDLSGPMSLLMDYVE